MPQYRYLWTEEQPRLTNEMACPSCRNLDPNFAKPTSRENHWKTGFSALCTTAEQGCESCELLRDGILKVQSIPSDLAAEYMLTFRPHMAWYQEDFSKRIDGLAVEIGKSDGVCLNFHTDDGSHTHHATTQES